MRLGARYSIVADELGVAFCNRRPPPPRAMHLPVARGTQHPRLGRRRQPVARAVLRVRRSGSSVGSQCVLGRTSARAVSPSPTPRFFAVVRSWKADTARALAAEGLELPPLTAPIPIIRQGRRCSRATDVALRA